MNDRVGVRFEAGAAPPRPQDLSAKGARDQPGEHAARAPYFHAARTGWPTKSSGFAPFRGRNFCTRPFSTSATYMLPSWSTLIPCTPHKAPGQSPFVPHEYKKCPSRSYSRILDVAASAAHRCRSADIYKKYTDDMEP